MTIMTPGRIEIGTTVRIKLEELTDEYGVAVDPTTVTFRTYSPTGVERSYTYAADEVGRLSAGNYYMDFEPDESGRWFYRWQAVGATATLVKAGSFLVQVSPFAEFDGDPGYA